MQSTLFTVKHLVNMFRKVNSYCNSYYIFGCNMQTFSRVALCVCAWLTVCITVFMCMFVYTGMIQFEPLMTGFVYKVLVALHMDAI